MGHDAAAGEVRPFKANSPIEGEDQKSAGSYTRTEVGKGTERITHPRQSAHGSGQPTRATAPLERVLLTGTGSAESIMASGQVTVPQQKAGHMAAPTSRCNVQNP